MEGWAVRIPAFDNAGTDWRVFLAFFACVALLIYVLGTWHGIGLRPDSVLYLGAWEERRQQAPLYGWLIDFGVGFGLHRLFAAWLVNAVLLVVNLAVFMMLLREARVTTFGVLCATAIVLLLPQFSYVHLTVLSEPIFILCLLASLLFTARYLETRRRHDLVLGALFAGAMVLARFAGVPIVGVGALAILLYGQGGLKARFLESVLFGLIGVGVFIGWLVLDQLFGGTGVGRKAALLGDPDFQTFARAYETYSTFFLPVVFPEIFRGLVLAGLSFGIIALGWVALRPGSINDRSVPPIARLSAVFIACYLPFLLFTLFVEANLPVHDRYLLPIYVCSVLLVAALFARNAVTQSLQPFALVVLLGGLFLAGLNGVRTVKQVYVHVNEGNYYASQAWQHSPTLERLKTLDRDLKIYTNAPDAVRMLADREAEFWPMLFDRRTGMDDPQNPLKRQLSVASDEVQAGQAVIVSFKPIIWRFYLMKEAELVEKLGLIVLHRQNDGVIYGSPTSAPK